MSITRLAPSPTGALHLGNARTFLINRQLASQAGWRVILRIEDLDGPRVKKGADGVILRDLGWLGINWDQGPIYQSLQLTEHRKAIARLVERGFVYPCVCTRSEVDRAASAPHGEDGAAVYPGVCRGKFRSVAEAREKTGREPALRFAAPDRGVEFSDRFRGVVRINVARELGDFVVAKSDGTPAYQLAVVVDDLAAGVDEVVRGDDLLDSTPRQMLLYEALGAGQRIPRYTHVPLVVGPDGRRLAKRHGDTRIEAYRNAGVKAQRVLALLHRWCGMEDGRFSLERISREPIVFTEADEKFLRETA